MTAAERLRLLGPETVAHIHREVAKAPDPPPEVVSALRRILAPAARAAEARARADQAA